MEYKMLNLFSKNPRQVLTRGQLLEKLWDIDERFVDEHTLTTSISRIRSKIESDGGAPYIKTERPCAAACGMGAIHSDELGRAEIDYSKCVSCGQCLVNCPFGAIADKGQIGRAHV